MKIGDRAFYGHTGLTNIHLPNTLTSIGGIAFGECTSLTSITCEATTPPTLERHYDTNEGYKYPFDNVKTSVISLYVPKESVGLYKETEYRKDFDIREVGAPGVDTNTSKMDNVIYAENASCFKGMSVTMNLKMKHTMNVSGFQSNLYLPEGFTIEKISRGEAIKVQDENEEYIYTFNSSTKEDGSRFLLCYSTTNTPMAEGEVEVMRITINVPDTMKAGEYPIILKNVELAYGMKSVVVNHVQSTLVVNDYMAGDANGDGKLSVGDIAAISEYLTSGAKEGFVVTATSPWATSPPSPLCSSAATTRRPRPCTSRPCTSKCSVSYVCFSV